VQSQKPPYTLLTTKSQEAVLCGKVGREKRGRGKGVRGKRGGKRGGMGGGGV